MPKILELPKIKPIVCGVCGCKYEFERGDELEPCLYEYGEINRHKENRRFVASIALACPVCGQNNNIEFEQKENGND